MTLNVSFITGLVILSIDEGVLRAWLVFTGIIDLCWAFDCACGLAICDASDESDARGPVGFGASAGFEDGWVMGWWWSLEMSPWSATADVGAPVDDDLVFVVFVLGVETPLALGAWPLAELTGAVTRLGWFAVKTPFGAGVVYTARNCQKSPHANIVRPRRLAHLQERGRWCLC